MLSLQAQYQSERFGIESVETPEWFYSFKVEPSEAALHVMAMFIHPTKREGRAIMELLDHIETNASERACKFIVAQVAQDLPGAERILTLHFKRGMKILRLEGTNILTYKAVQ